MSAATIADAPMPRRRLLRRLRLLLDDGLLLLSVRLAAAPSCRLARSDTLPKAQGNVHPPLAGGPFPTALAPLTGPSVYRPSRPHISAGWASSAARAGSLARAARTSLAA